MGLRRAGVELDPKLIPVLVGELDAVRRKLDPYGSELELQIPNAGRQLDNQRIVAVVNHGS